MVNFTVRFVTLYFNRLQLIIMNLYWFTAFRFAASFKLGDDQWIRKKSLLLHFFVSSANRMRPMQSDDTRRAEIVRLTKEANYIYNKSTVAWVMWINRPYGFTLFWIRFFAKFEVSRISECVRASVKISTQLIQRYVSHANLFFKKKIIKLPCCLNLSTFALNRQTTFS